MLGRVETRTEITPEIPPRSATAATPSQALTLTPVYRALSVIGTPVSKMRLDTYRFAGGVEQRIENPLFVNSPSLNDTRRELFSKTVNDLGLHGNVYWLKRFDTVGRVNSVDILPPAEVLVEQDINGVITYGYNGKRYSRGEIGHGKLFTRSGQIKGDGPIQLCRADIIAALDLRDYQSNWFSASGVPTGLLKTNKELTKAQADELTRYWHEKQAKRQTAVLAGYEYETNAPSPKDVMFTDVANQTVQNIARMFGIPARLLLTGVDGTSDTYTNLQDENQVFYRHTLMAYTDVIADLISECLPRGTSVRFNFESLFIADQEARFRMWSTALNGEAFMSTQEVREREGLNG
jgi:HK97 family phage portal protein